MLTRTLLALSLVAVTSAGAVFAQETATLVLRSGERIRGELTDHGGVGFTITVNNEVRRIPTDQVAVVDFDGTKMTDADWAKLPEGKHVVYLKNGMTFSGEFYDISGARPLQITLKTGEGDRRFSSTETTRIVLARTDSAVAATTGTQTPPPAATATSGTGGGIIVPAQQGWTSTGLVVRRGEWVTFNTTGEVRLTTDEADVAGAAGSAAKRMAANAQLPDTPIGTLIGRVGNSRPFVIGNLTRVQMLANGVLFLGVNDDHHADNAGDFRVEVQGGRVRRR